MVGLMLALLISITAASPVSAGGSIPAICQADASLAANTNGHLQPVANRPWPFNGRLTNGWDRPVEVWSDTHGTELIAPGTSTGQTEDVDYVLVAGIWYKIGIHHTQIDSNGHVTGYACQTGGSRGGC